jgi:hypothetical protein
LEIFMSTEKPTEFEQAAAFSEQSSGGIFTEFWAFLRYNKKWWLLPILVVILLLGVLVFLGSTGAAPFIYTLF